MHSESPDTRRKRVNPARQGPVRNPITGAHGPSSRPQSARPGGGALNGGAAGMGGIMNDALERGVRTAYTVIDEYMRRGYEDARKQRTSESSSGENMSQSKNNPYPNNPWVSFGMPMNMWMNAMRAWSEAWMTMMPNMMPPGMMPPWMMPGFPGAAMGYGASPATAGYRINVSSSSAAAVSASLNLMPGADCRGLRLGVLRPEQGQATPPIASISPDSQGTLSISINVPAKQEAGRFFADVLSPDGALTGRFSLDIDFPPPSTTV